jgi:proteasome lid subunit RPN8/RPN11
MLEELLQSVRRILARGTSLWRGTPALHPELLRAPETTAKLRPLERIVLTDGVSRTLFEEYARHRLDERGEEETGWILMGLRKLDEAIALATLPAGAGREAGVAHVRFNATAQAMASRILRQEDRRLRIVGIVHTHPGSLRHPSTGDFRGDRKWIKQFRDQEGVFGIGTADGDEDNLSPHVASQPKEHCQCYMGFRFSWYSLAAGDRNYRPLPVGLTIGPDMALPLHEIWSTLEVHGDRLDRLCRQLAKVRFEVFQEEKRPVLQLILPLAEDSSLRVVMRDEDVEYFMVRKDQWLRSECCEPHVDRGVFLILAAMAEKEG